MNTNRIIFVYNANSRLGQGLLDSLHKIVSPTTYDCNLCALTHGNFGPKKEWKSFLENTTASLEFYHKDEYQKQFASKFAMPYALPFVIKVNGYNEEVICSATKINSFIKLSDFISYLKQHLLS